MKKLDRDLGLLSIISIACGAMLSGLFVLPGHAALIGGPSVYLAFLLAGLLFVPAALSKAEMATALPEAGGDYIFIDRALGPMTSTVTGMGTWLALMLKSAFALVGVSAYLFLLIDLPTTYLKYFACGVALFLIVINCLGVKKTGQLQTVLVVISLATLTGFVEWGAIEVRREYYRPFFKEGWIGFISATAFVFVSYAGVTKVASAAEEVKDPGKNIPWGMLFSLAIMTILYAAVVFVFVGVVPMDEMASGYYKNAPIAQAAMAFAGRGGWVVLSVVAVLALTSMANAGLLASSRYPLAMSRYSQLPELFGSIHKRFKTPVLSVIVTGGSIILSIVFLPVIQLAKLASAFMLLVFTLVNISLIIFRESEIEWYNPEFRSPLYPYIQLFGAVSSLVLMGFMRWLTIGGSLVLIGIGFFWYFVFVRSRVERQGALFQSSATRREKEFFQEVRTSRYSEKESVIVPFFGLENRDMLHVERRIRLASALCDRDELLDVVDFVEVPDQAFLSNFEADPEGFEELKERVDLLRNEISNEIHLDQVITHNSRGALRSYAEEEKPHWVVFDWKKPSRWRILVGQKKWWLEDFPCDLFFYRDKGRQEFKKILALTEPGTYDGEVVYAADHLADYAGGSVKFLNPYGGPEHQHPLEFVESYQEELMSMCRSDVSAEAYPIDEWQEKLIKQTEQADLLVFGGLPEDLFEDCSLPEVMNEVIDDAECSVGRVQSNLKKPHSVLQKRVDRDEWPQPLQGRIEVQKLDVSNKDELFQTIANNLSTGSQKAEEIETALWAREEQQHTYLDQGLAVPHGFMSSGPETRIRLFINDSPISYGDREDQLASVFLALIGPPDERDIQLEIMSLFSELVKSKNLDEILKHFDDSEPLEHLLHNLEEERRKPQ